ncbi:MAG TPA: hypothetical protein VM681_08275 [Candidatus Thermoplasmatota archaeon]|nr:hypothetical protein [Candidatus Thermoplasmatota archaeon]
MLKDERAKVPPGTGKDYFAKRQAAQPATKPPGAAPAPTDVTTVVDASDESGFEMAGAPPRAAAAGPAIAKAAASPTPPAPSPPRPPPQSEIAAGAQPPARGPELGEFASRFEKVRREYLAMQNQLDGALVEATAKLAQSQDRVKDLEARLQESEDKRERLAAIQRNHETALEAREKELHKFKQVAQDRAEKIAELAEIHQRLGELLRS